MSISTVGEDVEQLEILHILLVEVKNDIITLENSLSVSYQDENIITIRPKNSTPRYLSRRKEIYVKTYTQMFITVLFIVTPNGNNLNAHNKWMNKHMCGIFIKLSTTQWWQETNYWFMQQHGWIPKTLRWVKEDGDKVYMYEFIKWHSRKDKSNL